MINLQFCPRISPTVIKRYESSLEQYFFYNAKNKTFWNCDSSTGTIVSCFDGSISLGKILEIICKNNPEADREMLLKKITEIIEFLLAEGFCV